MRYCAREGGRGRYSNTRMKKDYFKGELDIFNYPPKLATWRVKVKLQTISIKNNVPFKASIIPFLYTIILIIISI